MNKLAVAAVASLFMLVAGSELVRAEDDSSTKTDYASLTTDDYPPTAEATATYTKPLIAPDIIPWETRDTGFAAPTAEARMMVRKLHYAQLISKWAAIYGVPQELAFAVVRVESGFRPTMKGKVGEIGLMQVRPTTAKLMGYDGPDYGLYDPETNIRYGMKYLAGAQELGGGKVCGTILKYNAGHAAKRMNPVSKRYCDRVQGLIAEDEVTASVTPVAF